MSRERAEAAEIRLRPSPSRRCAETVHELARRFGLKPEDLNLDLGPLGRLI